MIKQIVIFIISAFTILFSSEKEYDFTPQLLIEAGANQRLDSAIAGQLFIEKMEAGFELGLGEKLTASTNLELCDDNTIELNEAKIGYAFTDRFTLSAGKLVTNFGDFSSEAITDPRIKDPCETKRIAVQADFTGAHLYSGMSVYNGIINNSFASIVPMIGFAKDEKFNLKLAARSELYHDSLFTDLSTVLLVSPIELITFRGELFTELNEKPITDSEQPGRTQKFGSMAEIDLYPSEKWTLFGRFDHLKDRVSELNSLMVQAGAGYTIAEQLRVALSADFTTEAVGSATPVWIPSLSAELKFEL